MTIKLLILGAGTFAQEVADLIGDIAEPVYEIAGFSKNDLPYDPQATVLTHPVYWVDDLKRFAASHQAVCAIGTTKRATFIQQAEEMGLRFATIVHPAARVSRTATIGAGSIISAGALIAAYTAIGRHVIVNRGAMIGHHVSIGDGATIGPGANLAGAVTVGARTTVAMGSIVLENRHIGSQSIVGAGSLVTCDVPDRVKVIGSPARIIEEDIDGL
jgi:sugar O-acyltransferase (sialic acid O-acetyltransferase NeuD family)